MIVVTNSTPIISLAKIDKLHLLRDIFGKIYVPNAVYKEVALKGKGRPGSKEIEEAEWVASKLAGLACVLTGSSIGENSVIGVNSVCFNFIVDKLAKIVLFCK